MDNYTQLRESYTTWIKELEPFDWFSTLTFKTDIITYASENPALLTSKGYTWADQTGKYKHGTFVRNYELVRLAASGQQWDKSNTYLKELQAEHSRRQYRRWIRKLNEHIYGRRYREEKRGVSHVSAIEFQKRGVAHVHALIKGIPSTVSRIQFEKVWESQHPNNGFANTFPYNPELGAAGYIGKYVTKGGQVEVYLSPLDIKASSPFNGTPHSGATGESGLSLE